MSTTVGSKHSMESSARSTPNAETKGAPSELLLPGSAYTSELQFEAERSAVFERSWIHVADTSELERPGDYVTATIGTTPVLIIRSHDGKIRGFLNVCRHRGATLAEAPGHCEHQLRCPYHAWSYATDGRLLGVPFREEFNGTEGKNLIPVRLGIAEPLVFACLDDTAPGFEAWIGKLAPALLRARGSEMKPIGQFEYQVNANWKLAMENALDSYHLPVVHAAGEGALIELSTVTIDEEEYASSAVADLAEALLPIFPPATHLDEWDRGHIRMGTLFPNFVAVLFPGALLYFRYDPLSVDRMRLNVRGFEFGTSGPELRAFRMQALDTTNQEDIVILERVQRGMQARGLPPFFYAKRLEQRIHHFQRMFVRAMSGAKLRLSQTNA